MKKVDLKVVLLGSVSVGKSCLCERFLHERFTKGQGPTIGAAFGTKEVTVAKRTTLNLGVWDTAGAERYESMTRHYFRGADAAIICYDLTDTTSFERMQHWVNELLKVCIPAFIIHMHDTDTSHMWLSPNPSYIRYYGETNVFFDLSRLTCTVFSHCIRDEHVDTYLVSTCTHIHLPVYYIERDVSYNIRHRRLCFMDCIRENIYTHIHVYAHIEVVCMSIYV